MEDEDPKFKTLLNSDYFFDGKKKIAKINSEIHSEGKSSDSPRGFKLGKAK